MPPELLADLALKVGVVGLSLYPIFRRGASHFAGKAMGTRALLYPLAVLVIPLTWLLFGRPQPYPFLADIALALPFALDAAGNVFGLFAIRRFDAIPHFFRWFFLSVAFGLAVSPLVTERWVAFGLAIGFGAVVDMASRARAPFGRGGSVWPPPVSRLLVSTLAPFPAKFQPEQR